MYRCQSQSQFVCSIGIYIIKIEMNLPCGSLVSVIIFFPAEQQRKLIETIIREESREAGTKQGEQELVTTVLSNPLVKLFNFINNNGE